MDISEYCITSFLKKMLSIHALLKAQCETTKTTSTEAQVTKSHIFIAGIVTAEKIFTGS